MPYVDASGVNPGWSDFPQPTLGMTTWLDVTPVPASIVPMAVTRYQARAALLEAGLLDQVNAHFAELPDDDMGKLAWNEAPTVRRDSDALISAARAMGLTDAQIDALFLRAEQFE